MTTCTALSFDGVFACWNKEVLFSPSVFSQRQFNQLTCQIVDRMWSVRMPQLSGSHWCELSDMLEPIVDELSFYMSNYPFMSPHIYCSNNYLWHDPVCFLAQLSQKFNIWSLSVVVVLKLFTFHLLLKNRLANVNKTWNKASLGKADQILFFFKVNGHTFFKWDIIWFILLV